MIIYKKNALHLTMFFGCLTNIQSYFAKEINTNIAEEPQFKMSKEKEFEEAVNYYIENKDIGETAEDVKRDIKSGSKLLSYTDYIKTLPEIYDWAHSNGLQDFRDIQHTFNKLKILMGIPDEVEIKFAHGPAITNGAIMGYNSLDRTVYIYPIAIDDHCRSFQLFTLIHELTHAQQHIRLGLIKSHLCSDKKKENEADLQAANAIQCHMCMQAIKADYLLHEATDLGKKNIKTLEQKGYLTGENITMITNTKQEKNICDFHLHFGKANELLYDRWLKSQINSSLMERFNFDKTNGSLEERLSTVDFRQND